MFAANWHMAALSKCWPEYSRSGLALHILREAWTFYGTVSLVRLLDSDPDMPDFCSASDVRSENS